MALTTLISREAQVTEMMKEHVSMWKQMGYGDAPLEALNRISCKAIQSLYETIVSRGEEQAISETRMIECLDNYGAACQCYYLFRSLHERCQEDTGTAVLLGDYYFGQFSHFLIPIDSPKLILLFSEQLQKETRQNVDREACPLSMEEYLAFVGQIPEQFVEEL